jgi:hypothetical protein
MEATHSQPKRHVELEEISNALQKKESCLEIFTYQTYTLKEASLKDLTDQTWPIILPFSLF